MDDLLSIKAYLCGSAAASGLSCAIRTAREGDRGRLRSRLDGAMAATAAETTTSRGTLRDAAGIGIGVGVYGISFGVLAVAAGMSTAQACVMSMLVFTGASQFAFVGVLAGGGTARSSRSSRRSCAGPARRSPRSRGR
jgi:hypothetical protein